MKPRMYQVYSPTSQFKLPEFQIKLSLMISCVWVNTISRILIVNNIKMCCINKTLKGTTKDNQNSFLIYKV